MCDDAIARSARWTTDSGRAGAKCGLLPNPWSSNAMPPVLIQINHGTSMQPLPLP